LSPEGDSGSDFEIAILVAQDNHTKLDIIANKEKRDMSELSRGNAPRLLLQGRDNLILFQKDIYLLDLFN
jgi:hypothetical protein